MKLSVLIIEDEAPAANKLRRLLAGISPNIEVVGEIPSVIEGIRFLTNNQVDLVLSDIHLTDGLSFEIFTTLRTDVPVIFTTAYDEYALEAFKLNSIDYLLKPIKQSKLEEALNKLHRVQSPGSTENTDYNKLLDLLANNPGGFKNRFLVEAANGEWASVPTSEIAYFFAEGKYTFLVNNEGRKFFSNDNITSLAPQLNPDIFFQLNRKFITHINSIKAIHKYSKSRLKVDLLPAAEDDIIVSTEKTPQFRSWLDR